ncbi:MAG: hypothetical protein LM550_03275 [Candidatus Contendobacter sp.]|nr:hypothetical protein [Candidatus Contendobacter sp.]
MRGKSLDELAALPKVEEKLEEELQAAADQARRYGSALSERYGLTDLRLFAVVGTGLERVVWQTVSSGITVFAKGRLNRYLGLL